MDIAKALIAGCATIISAIITLLLKEYFDRRKETEYEKVKSQIRDAVYGNWKGHYKQTLNGNMLSINLSMDLKVSSTGVITGKAKVPYGDETFELDIKGGFYSERFLKMDYENQNKSVLQFGAFIFKLSDNSKRLAGNFVGSGHVSGDIIGGNAILEKA